MLLIKPSFFKKNYLFLANISLIMGFFLMTVGAYYAIMCPEDYQHKSMVKMMFIHVPFSWLAMLVYLAMTFSIGIFFIYKNIVFEVIAIKSAKIGLFFCGLSLISGSIWGKFAWGVFWAWDARLTSMLCLFLSYCLYIAIDSLQEYNPNKHKILFSFAVLGGINIPIIKLSVEYWNTLHQSASIFRKGGVAIDPVFMRPLIMIFFGLGLLYIYFIMRNINKEFFSKKEASKR